MNNVSNYNIFDIKVDENQALNITPRLLNELVPRTLIVMRGATENLEDYSCGVYYFANAYKENNVYYMKLLAGTELFTYISTGLDVPFVAD